MSFRSPAEWVRPVACEQPLSAPVVEGQSLSNWSLVSCEPNTSLQRWVTSWAGKADSETIDTRNLLNPNRNFSDSEQYDIVLL